MDTLAKSDFFFIITTVSVVLVAVGFIVVLVYIIRILSDVKKISQRIEAESDLIAQDIEEVRSRGKGFVRRIIKMFFKFSKKGRS